MRRARYVYWVVLTLATACAGPAPDRAGVGADATAPAKSDRQRQVESTASPPPPDCLSTEPCRLAPRTTGSFDAAAVPEVSGLARSRRDPDLLWLADDRPGSVTLWAFRDDGRLAGTVELAGAHADNVEALAAGPCRPDAVDPCLFVGDIGDNTRQRTEVRIWRLPEPHVPGDMPAEIAADSVVLRYPEGPHDAEALLVDGDGVPYVITKASFDPSTGETATTRLFAGPGFRDGTMLDLGAVPLPAPATPVASLLYGNVVTGADSVPGRVLLRTYDQAVEFVAPTPAASLAEFPAWARLAVPAPWQPQPEAVAYATDDCGYHLVSERSRELWAVACRAEEGER